MNITTAIKDFFPEREIIMGIAEGNEHCFSRLFHKYRSKVFSIAFHLTKSAFAAEEITQEVFTAIWISRHKLPEVRYLDAYMNTVIYHRTITFFKKEKNWKMIVSSGASPLTTIGANAEENITGREIRELIENAVEQLPAQKRLIFRLSREGGLTYKQIADELDISPNTVKNHLVVAIKMLRNVLKHLPLPLLLFKILNFF